MQNSATIPQNIGSHLSEPGIENPLGLVMGKLLSSTMHHMSLLVASPLDGKIVGQVMQTPKQ
jgi:hypothetical protein